MHAVPTTHERFNKRTGTNLPSSLISTSTIPSLTHSSRAITSKTSSSKNHSTYYLLNANTIAWSAIITRNYRLLSSNTSISLAIYLQLYPPDHRCPYNTQHYTLNFFLATMAFPAEVGMIPNFLMIRDLGLLNPFGALVLPGLANGFGIFLLKVFFDSLPPELYEAALIDGASKWTMFWRITLPLFMPILAVMALGAFMFAFLVCQDQSMWTLMVFLYQFLQTYGNFMIMASIVVTAIPILVVFVLCQRVILRGIVIPTFK